MAYLNWRESAVRLKTKVHSEMKTELILSLSKEGVQSLISQLEEIYSAESGELRLNLPDRWILFWKVREEGARALLAHPAPEEWVGTIALEPQIGKLLLQALSRLDAGKSLVLSELLSLHSVSNLEMTLFIEE